MLAYPVILGISAVSLVVLAVMIWIISGSFMAGMVVLVISGLIYGLLTTFGVVDVNMGRSGLNVDFHETVPTPNSKHHAHKHKTMQIKEVFYVEGNQYTYNDAPAVCAAYNSELATFDQLTESFSLGAEWCGYGWSAGGMALFPTQEATWSAMQADPSESKRTACGHPGVNGGYFDPRLKFGVNCYGIKPANMGTHLPAPLPTADPAAFDKLVNKFKGMLHSMKIGSFNRDIWSKTGIPHEEAQKTKGMFATIGSDIEKDVGAIV